MSDDLSDTNVPWSSMGGPSLALMKLLLGRRASNDRRLAERLLREHPLVAAIDAAAAELRAKGRDEDALVLEDLAVPFRSWPAVYQHRLRGAGIRAVTSDYDVQIIEDPDDGEWLIEYLGRGRIAIRVPMEHRCQPTSLTKDQLRRLFERAEEL